MKMIRLTMKDTDNPIWVNVDRLAAVESVVAGGGSLVHGIGMSAIWVNEFPSEVFALLLRGGDDQ